ncbi:MAG: hypothetical protein LDLANPLL_00707 [Turneriella sp.]|nr:hypothetical protein [Turneriella sp.]
MRKALGSLLVLILGALAIFIVVSFFTRESFKNLSIQSPSAPIKYTRRMQETIFSVSAGYVSRYDYNMLVQKLGIFKEGSGQRILPVPINFYVGNHLTNAEYPLQGLDLFDPGCNVRLDKVKVVERYFKSLQVLGFENKKVGLRILSMRAIPESSAVRYSDSTPEAVKCLVAQMNTLAEIFSTKETINFVLPAFKSTKVNLSLNERTKLLTEIGKNLGTALAEAHKKNPNSKVRILLSNTIPVSFAQALPFHELVNQFVGLTPEELARIKSAALQNADNVPDVKESIEFALDTSVIWQLWQTEKIDFFKDSSGEPLLYEDLVLSLRKSLSESDNAGVLQKRYLKAIYASYARDNDEKKKWGESINLVYQRASVERLMKLQLQLFLDLFDFSAVGLENNSYVALEMPPREKFPLLFTLVRPLAHRWSLGEKKDGSDVGEIEDSLELLRNTVAQSGK